MLFALAAAAPAHADFAYDDFASTAGLQVNGEAHRFPPVLRISASAGRGSAFTTQPVIGSGVSWESRFVMQMHGGSSPPADGMAFVVQRDPRGAGAMGVGGGGNGYGTSTNEEIKPSAIVEFDIYYNWTIDDPDDNHVGITTNGVHEDTIVSATPPFRMHNAPAVYAWVAYDAVAKRLDVFVNDAALKPSTPLVSAPLDLGQLLGGPARAGFTAARGSLWANFDVLSWHLDTPPQCADELDNDFDGVLDATDTGCSSPSDETEALPGEGAPIAFSSTRPDRTSTDAFRIEADGSGEERLTWADPWSSANEYRLDWSPDGTRLAYDTERDGAGAQVLWTIAADGTDAQRVAGPEGAVVPGSDPSWDPTGKHLAFTHHADGDGELFRIPAAGGAPLQLTDDAFEDVDPAWSPDGKTIVFASDRGGDGHDLWSIPAHGDGDPVRLTDDQADERTPAWSPDGSLIAFTRSSSAGVDEVVVMRADGSGAVVVTEGRDPTFSPDCTRVAFVAETLPQVDLSGAEGGPSGQDDVYSAKLDGSARRAITTSFTDDDGSPDWRPEPGDFACTLPAPQPPSLSVADIEVDEHDEAAAEATFVLKLASKASTDLDFTVKTAAGTATAGDDFEVVDRTVELDAGEQSRTFTVNVPGDRLDEDAETFHLDMSGAGLTETIRATATILDDDAPPPLTVSDAWVIEGHSGTQTLQFRVALAKLSGKPVTVGYRTSDETATAGTDYDAHSGELTLPAGTRDVLVGVPVRGDTAREYDFERLRLDLVGASNPLDAQRAIGTIVDDDPGNSPAAPSARPATGDLRRSAALAPSASPLEQLARAVPAPRRAAKAKAKAKANARAKPCPRSKRAKARCAAKRVARRASRTRRTGGRG